MDTRFYDALSSAVYLAKTLLPSLQDDDQRIRASGLYADWVAGNHVAGEIYNAEGQTWECYQDYDNGTHPDITPGSAAWPTFNRPLHGKSRETARPWVQPTHAGDIYKQGEWMIWADGSYCRCIAPDGTSYSPDDYPAAWEVAEA